MDLVDHFAVKTRAEPTAAQAEPKIDSETRKIRRKYQNPVRKFPIVCLDLALEHLEWSPRMQGRLNQWRAP